MFVKSKRIALGVGIAVSGLATYYGLKKSAVTNRLFCSATAMSKYHLKNKRYNECVKNLKEKVEYFEEEKKDDWKLYFEKNGCRVERLSIEGSDFYVIRGSGKTKSKKSVEEIVKTLNDFSVLHSKRDVYLSVDPDNKYFKILETLIKGKQYLCHARWTTNSWIVSDRDFVILRDTSYNSKKNEGLMIGGSIDFVDKETEYPKDDECVRGELGIFYWKITKDNDGFCQVNYVTQIDPKGYIPTFLYNMFCHTQTYGILMNAKKVLEELDEEDNI